jgi:tetratricopeptide (TPR) repeat protein
MDDLTELLDRLIHSGLIALAALSLIVFGARYPYGQAAAVILAALLLVAFAVRTALAGEFRLMATPLDLAAAATLVLLLVQLGVGYPWSWLNPPSGEALLSMVGAKLGVLPALPGTLDVHATRLALVLFLVYGIVFYLTLHSLRSRPTLDRLVASLVVLVAVIAGYGLFEALSGSHGILGWKGYGTNRVRGTLVNPDHFAATLIMVAPVAVGFLLGSTARRRRRRRAHADDSGSPIPQSAIPFDKLRVPSIAEGRNPQSEIPDPPLLHGPSSGPSDVQSDSDASSLFERHRSFRAGERESRRYLWLLGCVALMVAVVFTMSRAGIIAGLGGGVFLVTLLWLREPRHRKGLSGLIVILAALTVIAWIGAEPVLSRFMTADMDSRSRTMLYRATVKMIGDFPVLGVGLGAFERVTPRYAPAEIASTHRLDHAHSEPLQLVAEAGIPGALILLLALVMLFKDVLLRRLFGLGKHVEFRMANVELGSDSTSGSSNPKSEIRNPKSPAAPVARHDPYNIAIAFGALTAVVAVGLHACLDFPLRIPANAILLAMILAIGIAAAAVRFHTDRAEPLARVRVLALSRRGKLLTVAGAAAVALFMGWTVVAALLGAEYRQRGYAIMAGESGAEGGDRPWLVETSKNKEALAYLGGAVSADPTDAFSQYLLGRLYDQLALRAWNAGLSEGGRFLPDAGSRARSALQLLDQASHQYATAIALTPSLPDAWSHLGWSAGVRGSVLSGDSARMSEGAKFAQLAVNGMRQGIELNPNNRYRYEMLAGYGMARIATQPAGLGDPLAIEGLQALRQAVELDPAFLPEALRRTLRLTQDLAAIQMVIPAHAPDLLFAGRLLEEDERWPESKRMFRSAIDVAPDDGKPLYYREYAEALARHGEDAEMRDVLDLVLRFDPQNLDLKLAMARGLTRLGRTGEALAMYQEALGLAEKSAERVPVRRLALGSRRKPLLRIGMPREERVFLEMANRFPETRQTADPLTRALTGLAAFYHQQRQDNLAVPLWEKALQRTPDDDVAAFGLARSYDAVGAWVSALDYYKKAIELNRGNIEYRVTLAERYFANDMNFQAINLWRDVLAARPNLIDARLRLAEAFVKLEQYPDALREYERVLQLDPQNPTARVKSLQLRGRFPGI